MFACFEAIRGVVNIFLYSNQFVNCYSLINDWTRDWIVVQIIRI